MSQFSLDNDDADDNEDANATAIRRVLYENSRAKKLEVPISIRFKENTEGKGEIAPHEQFLLVSHCFHI